MRTAVRELFYGFVGRFWDGVIDEAVIYNRALSADEVQDLFSKPPVSTSVEPGNKLATVWGYLK